MGDAPLSTSEIVGLLDEFPGASSSYPFGPGAQVWKVRGKMFALVPDDVDPPTISLKCEPELAIELRSEFPSNVSGAYHMNKKHWNSIISDALVPGYELEDWIGHSYDLVVASLSRADRTALVGLATDWKRMRDKDQRSV